MKRLLSYILLFYPLCFFAQQQTQYSQYMYSLFSVNPAYAGTKDYVQALITERNQWVGFEGAPHSQSLIIHTPFKKKMGLGLNLYNESIGAHGSFGAFGSYSYAIKSAGKSLSFGLRAGFYSYRINPSLVTYKDPNDQNALNNLQSNFTPSFDAGIHYYNGNFIGGASVNNLQEGRIYEVVGDNIMTNTMKRHLFLYTGYVFSLNPKWKMRPSLMAKMTQAAPVNMDFNLGFIFNEKIHFSSTYRSSKAIILMTQYFIGKNFRVGYAFDYDMNLISGTGSIGTHEILLGIDFNFKNAALLSPRYL